MTILLDTHVLIWAAGLPEKLPPAARAAIENPETEMFYSAASLWEIAIKSGMGRADFSVDPRVLRHRLRINGYSEVPVVGAHAAAVDLLPPIHKDPFDRLLVAQAQIEGLTLWTADAVLGRYAGSIRVI
ncbi:type II toxin-antitoxin system VapC family toxin [Candidatus Palauibacter soopunensis]|uniref:type II toxin-antitoxin system VapC family toxin n=1 Tax=Candidatus Palauibacter soopunensis TaxID=3056739 RepID=UPI002384E286|nr:type II toxin-antitoxin system VapC family toxin [Candidatus Palauibacter soopunensis]MDE2878066.1 type II toxin-antitoxin system VapC family toxin [Candidatus Palauibacter soopunensis]